MLPGLFALIKEKEMFADIHLHSEYSFDSQELMENQVKRAVEIGLPVMCFTDHIDWDFPLPEMIFDYNVDEYMNEILLLQEKYKDQIRILMGVELGMQPQLGDRYSELLKKYPFDFVISSQHLVKLQDPYYPQIFEELGDRKVFEVYFEETLENLQLFHDADTMGHLDYVVRYGQNGAHEYNYNRYGEIIDEILNLLIRYDIALEVNSAGIRKGLGFPNPHPDVIRRYRELGGKLITVGSDAHVCEDIGKDFNLVEQILKSIGFTETCYYVERSPMFLKI